MSWNEPANYNEELDDDVPELPPSKAAADKIIRRRSSKACDQCRKSKCKCERTGSHGDPCRSCLLLGTRPSRKRGPPKGYIDAIESRLHQLEALLGIIISSSDPRAQSLVADLAQDSLARDIIARVHNSPFGSKGRKKPITSARHAFQTENDSGEATGGSSRHSTNKRQQLANRGLALPSGESLPFVTPSNEWQDYLSSLVLAKGVARQHGQLATSNPFTFESPAHPSGQYSVPVLPPLQVDLGNFAFHEDVKPSPHSADSGRPSNSSDSPTRRQRRRMDAPDTAPAARDWSSSPDLSDGSAGDTTDTDEVADAVGQLSLDEHEQFRYHGKASGLHLLGKSDRRDKRQEGGIWRFPPARIWPPVANRVVQTEEELAGRARLPSHAQQEHLVELYFIYIHPVLPVILKNTFMHHFRERSRSPYNDGESPASFSDTTGTLSRKVPTLLLLAMFATAARYSDTDTPPPPEGTMWTAGDVYLEDAKTILNQIYASSSPSTCQALLLLSYREVGIGAMAQAWIYVGMAVRMAQDLGLNRSVDKWQRGGENLFSYEEQQLRRRIWYTCVIMDKYVSTYIGRPLSIFERDFDTPLPDEDEAEESEPWEEHQSLPQGVEHHGLLQKAYIPMASRPVATFNASATLSSAISHIVHSLYSIRSSHSATRQAEAYQLEKKLDKWHLDLPEHFRYDPALRKLPIPPPNVLTLLMQYWTTVLLLHRPFIQFRQHSSPEPAPEDSSATAQSMKSFDMCMSAATHISSIVAVYMENFCPKRSAAFLSYYIFSAGIMHVTTLSMRPSIVQAALGLQKCMEALKKMEVIWPSAARAWELLHGSNVEIRESELARLSKAPPDSRRKRPANDTIDQDDQRSGTNSSSMISRSHPETRTKSISHPYGIDLHSSDPCYSNYRPTLHPQPLQPLGSDLYNSSSVDPGMLPTLGSFSHGLPPSSGRFPNYWGEYTESFGDPTAFHPSALASSLYSHPLLAGPLPGQTQPVLLSMFPEYTSYGAGWSTGRLSR